MGLHDRGGASHERRHVLAPAGPHSRYRSCDLALLAAPPDEISGEAFNIGTAEQNYRIRDLADVVQRRFPTCEVTFARGASPDPRSYRVDFSKFTSRFPNCELEWTAVRGVDELAERYETVGLTWEEFEGGRYTRLTRLKTLLDADALEGDLRWISSAA
jgi:hypothetical protein